MRNYLLSLSLSSDTEPARTDGEKTKARSPFPSSQVYTYRRVRARHNQLPACTCCFPELIDWLSLPSGQRAGLGHPGEEQSKGNEPGRGGGGGVDKRKNPVRMRYRGREIASRGASKRAGSGERRGNAGSQASSEATPEKRSTCKRLGYIAQ